MLMQVLIYSSLKNIKKQEIFFHIFSAFSEFLLRDRKDSIPPKLERIRYSEFVSTTDLVSPPKFPFPQQDVQVSYADKHTITKTVS